VAKRALELDFVSRVVVAADDESVADAVSELSVDAVLTDPTLGSGTERVAAVALLPQYADFAVVLNIQGDEPFLPAHAAEGALERIEQGDAIGTAGAPLTSAGMADVHRVKVVVDAAGRALRFSRVLPASFAWTCNVSVLQHIGVYAYRRSVLKQWCKWSEAPNELEQGLEQLRPLHHGVSVGVARVGDPIPPAIDTEEDLAEAEAYVETMTQGVGQ
jgi:3-deoxy-manno-octulosonate cytidylyltransferase (CMP-KDO synthetase)